MVARARTTEGRQGTVYSKSSTTTYIAKVGFQQIFGALGIP